jgi:hypothetical protein
VEDERVPEHRPEQRREYSPPAIATQHVFETTALACGKLVGQGGAKCSASPKAS